MRSRPKSFRFSEQVGGLLEAVSRFSGITETEIVEECVLSRIEHCIPRAYADRLAVGARQTIRALAEDLRKAGLRDTGDKRTAGRSMRKAKR